MSTSTTTQTTVDPWSPVPPGLQDLWLSTEEACDALGIAKETLYKKIAGGLFETTRYGRRTLVSRASVQRYLDQFRHVSG